MMKNFSDKVKKALSSMGSAPYDDKKTDDAIRDATQKAMDSIKKYTHREDTEKNKKRV